MFKHPSDPEIGRFELLNHATIAQLAGARPPPPCESPFYPAPLASNTTKTFECEFAVQPSVRAMYDEREAEAIKEDLATLEVADPTVAAHCEYVTDTTRLREELRVPGAVAAVITDTAGRMWPYKFVAGVVEDLLLDPDVGSRFNLQTHTPVTRVERTADEKAWRVVTDRGTVEAEHVVLATNGYTSHLLPAFEDLIVPCRGQMSALKPSKELRDAHRLRTSFGFEGPAQDSYLIQRPNSGGGQLMFGGGGQYGNRIGNADDSVIDDKVAAFLKGSLPVLLGSRDKTPLEAEKIWTGVMGYSRDERPYIGPLPGHEGLFLAAGFTGHGMPNTWLCGRAVADMVARVEKGEAVDDAVAAARRATLLPKSYLVTPERVERARREPTVLEQDRAEFLRGGEYRD